MPGTYRALKDKPPAFSKGDIVGVRPETAQTLIDEGFIEPVEDHEARTAPKAAKSRRKG